MNGLSARDFLKYKEDNDPEDVKDFVKECCYKVSFKIESYILLLELLSRCESI